MSTHPAYSRNRPIRGLDMVTVARALLLVLALVWLPACSGASEVEKPASEPAAAAASTEAPAANDALDRFINSTMASEEIPGLAVAVVRDKQVLFAKGYGFADLERQIPATADTGFLISSCSKTIGAVTLMELYDQGKFKLDEDVNDFLPFSARNPHYPQKPITIRQLLTHTSSLARDWEDQNGDDSTAPGDPKLSLGDFLKSYFTPGTPYYRPDNFLNAAPGSTYQYSNIGAALWAYVAERIAGVPFYTLTRDTVFSKLGMTNTSWRLSDLDQSKLAVQYHRNNGRLSPLEAFSYFEYPAGSVRTSADQLAKFLLMFMNDGSYPGGQLLKPQTAAEMRRRQIPNLDDSQALVWYYDSVADHTVLGHDGTDTGSGCYMFYRPSDKTGVIILMNVRNSDKADEAIAPKLFDLASGH
jgi:CubicO group peptidase (beta-lactamase class C family)